jgi:hypothetical protein
METLIKKYVDAGVIQSKIIVSRLPSVCNWSLSRNCLVGENNIELLEVLDNGDGNKRISFENNRIVSMQNRTEINIDEINNSNGIIISNATYGKPYFRFGFIPTE